MPPPPSSPVTGARTASSTGSSNHLALKIALPVALGVALALALVLCCCCFLYVSVRVLSYPAWNCTSCDGTRACTCSHSSAVCESMGGPALVLVLREPHWHLLGSTLPRLLLWDLVPCSAPGAASLPPHDDAAGASHACCTEGDP